MSACQESTVRSIDARKEQAAVWRQNQTDVTADDSSECKSYWILDKLMGENVKVGGCCTTKCNGKSDFNFDGKFFDCKAGTCSGMSLYGVVFIPVARMIFRTSPYPPQGVPL